MSENDADRETRILAAIEACTAEAACGRRPSRRELYARFPDIADDLSACLAGLAFVKSAGAGLDPALDPSRHSAADAVAEPLGDFHLIREIGRGGMGIVYEAVQRSLGRRVAVKVLPLAAAMDTRRLDRFHNEAQAAARLHHTNIVPVYAVGCERSVHFYAMQLIEGHSLADVIEQLRALPVMMQGTRPGNTATAAAKTEIVNYPGRVEAPPDTPAQTPAAPLSGSAADLSSLRGTNRRAYARAVANFGMQVAEGLEYAHRAGIVHRDIKPANLLLDAQGVVWITDFGLAQFYIEGDLTLTNDVIGTMRYMSPEQASGRAAVLDQRTDVYSLGTTLYEMLTLRPAVTGHTHAELLRKLTEEEPAAPRSIDRTIPREIEIILGKAMAKAPDERYESAREFADDLRRFLHDEPIKARAPTARDKALKWIRRHKALTASAMAFATLAALGFSVSTVVVGRAQAKTAEAYRSETRKSAEASRQRARAERNAADAREVVDFLANVASSMDRPDDFTDAKRAMLDAAVDYYQGFLDELTDRKDQGASLTAAQDKIRKFLDQSLALDAANRAALRSRLLTDSNVQKELRIGPAEAAQLPRFANDEFFGRGPGGPDGGPMNGRLSPAERQNYFEQQVKLFDDAVLNVLGVARAERLTQLQRQARGTLTFRDPDVVQLLTLDRAQRAKIRGLRVPSHHPEFGGAFFDFFNAPVEEDETAEEQMTQVFGLLTAEQRVIWQQKVIGAETTIDLESYRYSQFDRGPRRGKHGRFDDVGPRRAGALPF